MRYIKYIAAFAAALVITLQAAAQPSEIKQLSADFVQTKTLKLLSEKMVSYGKVYYGGGAKLRWEYTQPYQYTFVLNGNKVLLKHPDRTDVIDVSQNKLFKEIAHVMMGTVLGSAIKQSKDFDVTFYKGNVQVKEAEDATTVHLVPKRKDLKAFYTKIILHVGENQVIKKVELIEKSGDLTLIELKNIKINEPIAEKIFTVS